MPVIDSTPKHKIQSKCKVNKSDNFVRPNITALTRSKSSNHMNGLKKSSSYQNIKMDKGEDFQSNLCLNSNTCDVPDASKIFNKQNLHSTNASTPLKQLNFTASEPHFQTHLRNIDSQKSHSNAHRIHVNSDLLSRVEKEKKQYESRISELTQITETRKMEIEKLTFEVRRAKEDTDRVFSLVEEIKHENVQLRAQLAALGSPYKKDEQIVDGCQVKPASTQPRKYSAFTSSPPESLGTTTRLTPGGTSTAMTGAITASSRSSEWNDHNIPGVDDSITFESICPLDVESLIHDKIDVNAMVSVATLQGRLQQMEEANYTTNEELQATLQELWDLQKSVDEAHEETHSLAFERAILLEALSTQTSKLEHCRFQIEQLKQLLLTNKGAQTSGTRENHFCELYTSVEQEKQVLLTQNNDLAQSSDSLARECRVLTEKASALQDSYDALEAEHNNLEKAYQTMMSECNTLKGKMTTEQGLHKIQSHQIHEFNSVAIQTDVNFLLDLKEEVLESDKIIQKLNEITKESHSLKEQLELLQCERERETMDWKLYERDLLKAVRVADAIKTEAENETRRLKSENLSLKEKVELQNKELSQNKIDLDHLKDKLFSLSEQSNDGDSEPLAPLKSDSHNDKGNNKSVAQLNKISTPNGHINNGNVKLQYNNTHHKLVTQAEFSTNSMPNRLNSLAITDASYAAAAAAGRVSLLQSYTHRNSSFMHNNFGNSTSSPGAPGRSSVLTTGPTVRSLIQSIENQVKAVQHQKRGLTSTSSLNGAKASLRLYPNGNSTSNSIDGEMLNEKGSTPSSNVSINSVTNLANNSTNNCSVNNNINNNASNYLYSPTNGYLKSNTLKLNTSKSRNTDPVLNKLNSNELQSDLNLIDSSAAPGGPTSSFLTDPSFPQSASLNLHAKLRRNNSISSGGSTTITSAAAANNNNIITSNNGIAITSAPCVGGGGGIATNSPLSKSDDSKENLIPSSLVSDSPSRSTRRFTTPSLSESCSKPKKRAVLDHSSISEHPTSLATDTTTTSACTTHNMGVSNMSMTNHNMTENNNDKINNDISHANHNYDNNTINNSNNNDNMNEVNNDSSAIDGFHTLLPIRQDPLQELARMTGAGSKRNALLKWCQSRILSYPGVEVTNFSRSWNNGLALCALIHSYNPSKIPWNELITPCGLPVDKQHCFEVAFKAAESVGIPTTLHLQDMLSSERPDWSMVMNYVISIYKHYELRPSADTTNNTHNADAGIENDNHSDSSSNNVTPTNTTSNNHLTTVLP